MKIGFGLYRHMLDDAHFAFARQCGATHVVVHMCDYFRGHEATSRADQPVGDGSGWGIAEGRVWTADELIALRDRMAQHGLTFYAIENFDPGLWDHILFDGPKRDAQMAGLQQLIRNVGAAGIGVYGYNFSLAGVAGRVTTHGARGAAPSVGLDGRNAVTESPLPASMAWNMVVDEAAEGLRETVPREVLWQRLRWFLDGILPVAEAAGVVMAAHPDDPPLDMVRGQPRLVYQPHLYQTLLDTRPSLSNALEFCLGRLRRWPPKSARMTCTKRCAAMRRRVASPTCTCATCAAACRITARPSSTRATWISRAWSHPARMRVRRRAGARPRAADVVRRTLARRDGVRDGLYQRV